MTCDIFIRSYRRDFPWLELCLASIERYAYGFRSVIVLVPRSSVPWLSRLRLPNIKVRIEVTRDYADDYLGQQVTKLFADELCDAEFICHVDSDCVFSRPVTPGDLLAGGKPILVMRPYAALGRHWPWQAPTETFLGWPVTHDFMQQPPFTYPRWLYKEIRAHSERVHSRDLVHYVTSRPPRGFSEFNVLGAFARARHEGAFSWVDSSVVPPPEAFLRWYWSWGGVDDDVRRDVQRLLDLPDVAHGSCS